MHHLAQINIARNKAPLDSIEMKEHNSTVSFLAGMIANEVGIESSKAVKLVGIAALLHDIGLYDINPDFKEENLGNLDEEITSRGNQSHNQHKKDYCFRATAALARRRGRCSVARG